MRPAAFSIFLILVSGLMLTACGHMPVTSMLKLSRLDILQVNPAAIRVAVRSPVYMRVKPKSAVIAMSATLASKSAKPALAATFTLTKENVAKLPAELAKEQHKDSVIAIYRLPPDDIIRWAKFRERFIQLEQAHGDDIEGSMSITVAGCTLADQIDKTKLKTRSYIVTTYLKPSLREPFFPFLRNVDLKKEQGFDALAENLAACPPEAGK